MAGVGDEPRTPQEERGRRMTALLTDLIRWATVVVQHLEYEAVAYPERRTAHLAEQGRELIGRMREEVR